MARIFMWPYAPALVVILGAILAAFGGFWQAVRQSNFTAEIRQKNEQVTNLQQENIRVLKGSDFLRFDISWMPNQRSNFRLTAINDNDLPVYDVALSIRSHVDHPWDTPTHQAEAMDYLLNRINLRLGTIPPGAHDITALEPGYYQIDVLTRYASYTEMLKFGPFENVIGQSYVISIPGKPLIKHTSPAGFFKIYSE